MSPNWCSFCADSCKGRTTKRQRADHLRLAPTLKGQNMRQSLLPEAPQRNAVYIPHAILHASHHEAPSVLVRVQVQRQPVKTRHQVCSQKQCDKAQSSRATSPKTTPQPPGLEQIGKRFVALENSHAAVAVARVAQRLQALIVRVCLQAGYDTSRPSCTTPVELCHAFCTPVTPRHTVSPGGCARHPTAVWWRLVHKARMTISARLPGSPVHVTAMQVRSHKARWHRCVDQKASVASFALWMAAPPAFGNFRL